MRFTGVFIAIAGVAFWLAVEEYWEKANELLNSIYPNLAGIILLALMIAGGLIFVYDYKKQQSGKSESNKDIYRKLHGELKDSIDSLDGTLLDKLTREHEIDGKKVKYKHIYMNHKVFDGYVNSGNFNHIHHELQQPIQDIYGKIEIHNELVEPWA